MLPLSMRCLALCALFMARVDGPESELAASTQALQV
jgi:hypothetical protein